jgi:hypothetical protein
LAVPAAEVASGYQNQLPVAPAEELKKRYLGSSLVLSREASSDSTAKAGYVRVDEGELEVDVKLDENEYLWAAHQDSPEQEARAKSMVKEKGPSFSLSKMFGFEMIDRFHKVVELLNASPTPSINIQLECHREMHTITANFRNDAIMYGRVIISEVALPVEKKTIKPLDASGILGGDKYRVGSVYFS